ncbi:MAG: GHKL domain-containing protein [Alphaproteobacteria bacterium]|nr:GHKL domain-containing protein [Alphaproteobacteria bacterium]NCQ67310.1 GHKL domain-containing protein [Alphaproteobacteria bacterium]NCT06723.1 GHKL domain-containing protein [Alphaproteobacteria bacterium]
MNLRLLEQTQAFNNVLRVRYDAVKAMQRQARKFLEQELQMFSNHLEMKDISGKNTYYLATRGGKGNPYGLLVGQGHTSNLKEATWKELQMAFSLMPLVSVLKNSIQSVTGFHYTSKNDFYFRYPWSEYQDIKFDSGLYKKEYYLRSIPANNREDKVFWTDVFLSPVENALLVTCAAPIYKGMSYQGVVGIDFTLDSVDFFVESLHHNQGNFLVINDHNTVIADLAVHEGSRKEIAHLENIIPQDLPLEHFVKVSDATLTRLGDYWIYVAHTSFAPWQVIYYVENKAVTMTTFKNILPSLLLVILFTTIFLVVANRLIAREFITPASLLVRHIEKQGKIKESELKAISEPWAPWFHAISNVFGENKALVEKLEKHIDKLDDQVAKRTLDLSKKNKQLEQAFSDLKKAQSQIITQEKLAGLGSLTAGIAHEIRNPLNFIVNFAENSRIFGEEISEGIHNIAEKLDKTERETLLELSNHLLKNMEKINEHGRRADAIVNSMLTHAHGGKESLRSTNLQELLDENILLGLASFKQKGFTPNLRRHYAPTLGEISVYPQDLGRVFLNMINNACYILHEKSKKNIEGYSPQITVTTLDDPDSVTIKIRDNGLGMTSQVKKKLFEPFFTTKPTGQGTGLGLSLSFEIIVRQHHGKLSLDTELGKFTEFVIVLPKNLRKAA